MEQMEQMDLGALLLSQTELRLRDHQQAMAETVLQKIADGQKRILIIGTCGIGKTEIASWLMRRMANAAEKAFFVADRTVLVNQTSERLSKYGVEHGIIQSKNTRDTHNLIMVCSKQSMKPRHFNVLRAVVFIDECHENYQWIKNTQEANPHLIFIGLTGSPFTLGLRKLWDCLVSGPTIAWLTENKYLAPVKHYACKEIDMRGAQTVAGEWTSSEVEARSVVVIGDIIEEYKSKSQEHFGGPVKGIFFGSSIKHCEQQAQAFSDAGFYATTISSNTPEANRKDILRRFKNNEILILCSCEVLAKGFDQPDVMIGMGARPYRKSFNKFIQSKERVARAHPSKKYALWLDFSGNMDRFYEQYRDFRENGITDIEELDDNKWKEPKTKSLTTGDEKELICPECHYIFEHPASECPECGYIFKRKVGEVDIVQVKGEMVAIDDDIILPVEDRLETLKMLKGYALDHNYKLGWAAVQFKERFNEWPPKGYVDRIDPLECSVEIANWVKSRQIAWAHSRKNPKNQET